MEKGFFITSGPGLLATSSKWHSKRTTLESAIPTNYICVQDVPIKEIQGRNEQNVIRVHVSLFFSAIV